MSHKRNFFRSGFTIEPPTSYYNAENDYLDELGVSNFTSSDNLTYTTGIIGNAFEFNGTNAAVDGAFGTLAHNGTNETPFSLNIWFWSDNLVNARYLACSQRNASSAWNWHIWYIAASSRMVLRLRDHTNNVFMPVGGVVSSSAWNMITYVYDGVPAVGCLKCYVNGAFYESNSTTAGYVSNTASTGTPLTLAGYKPGGAAPTTCLDCLIDAVGVWRNYQLTADEVAYLYNSGAGRQYPF